MPFLVEITRSRARSAAPTRQRFSGPHSATLDAGEESGPRSTAWQEIGDRTPQGRSAPRSGARPRSPPAMNQTGFDLVEIERTKSARQSRTKTPSAGAAGSAGFRRLTAS